MHAVGSVGGGGGGGGGGRRSGVGRSGSRSYKKSSKGPSIDDVHNIFGSFHPFPRLVTFALAQPISNHICFWGTNLAPTSFPPNADVMFGCFIEGLEGSGGVIEVVNSLD